MAIAFGASTGNEFTAATSYTQSAVSVSGTNTYALVMVGLRTNTGDITGVTFNGVAMTELSQLNNAGGTHTLWMFGLAGPTTGDVVVTGDTSLAAEVITSIYTGVHQTTPTGTVATATGNSTAPSVAVTSAALELVVDHAGWNSGAGQIDVGAGQTERKRSPASGDGISMNTASSDEAGAASVTMSWTIVTSQWLIQGVPLKPAPVINSNFLTFFGPQPQQ